MTASRRRLAMLRRSREEGMKSGRRSSREEVERERRKESAERERRGGRAGAESWRRKESAEKEEVRFRVLGRTREMIRVAIFLIRVMSQRAKEKRQDLGFSFFI